MHSPSSSSSRSAWVAGATGLIGGFLVDHLLADDRYHRVEALLRRPLDGRDGLVQRQVDFGDLTVLESDQPVDDAFCCLGTTLRTAGSRQAFRRVDLDYVVSFATAAQRLGAQRLMLVSSIGAEAGSNNFYLQVKGEAEEGLAGLGFTAFHVLRPSLLLGPRRERRPGEKLASLTLPLVSPLLLGGLRRYRPIQADTVARAMIGAAQSADGHHIHNYKDLIRLAASV